MSRKVVLYGKPDCHLCHEAEALLAHLQQEFAFSVEKIDILGNLVLEAKYRYAIPVIVVNGRLELPAPILERELRAALRSL